jgi:hypothetical protein
VSTVGRFIDDPHAPELYASNFSGVQISLGNVVVTLESARVDHSTDAGVINRVVIGRVVMPIAAARVLAMQLNALLGQDALGRISPRGGATSTQ